MPNPIEKMAAKGAGKAAAIGARAKGLTGVFNTLAEQHQEAAVLLKRAESVDDPKKRADLWQTIRRELLSHERAEINVVYPALKQNAAVSDIPRHHNEEVPELEAAIREIDNAGFDSPSWSQLVARLRGLVEHHATEEEKEFFPRAEEALGKQASAELDERFMAAKEQAAKGIH
jgi:iron-sulfur cluster repair protein YtfE (RIC family)